AIDRPGVPLAVTEATPWLYNGTLSLYITDKLAAYGSYTRGLEESGSAPDSATNRGAALPAVQTSQVDAGFRYTIIPGLRLVAGVFEVKKPHFDLDNTGFYGRVGNVSHRGVELSLAGKVTEGLTIVAGTVLLKARVKSNVA